jgi:prevent-host-death family protein
MMKGHRVGVRELRQNLSKYLRRVERGERLEVTERGRPVAVLAPIGAPASPMERLIATGRATAPTIDILSLLPPPGRVSTRASEALLDDRADRL